MNIHIHNQHPEVTAAVHSQITACLQHALGRLAERVGDVTVHLRTAHGSRGDVNTHCHMLAALTSSPMVIVESLHTDQTEAIAQAGRRLGQAVEDQLSERHQVMARAPVTARIAVTALFRRRPTLVVPTAGCQPKDLQSNCIST